jgi:hypothetical protein
LQNRQVSIGGESARLCTFLADSLYASVLNSGFTDDNLVSQRQL